MNFSTSSTTWLVVDYFRPAMPAVKHTPVNTDHTDRHYWRALHVDSLWPEAGSLRLEAGGWRLEAGGWRLEADTTWTNEGKWLRHCRNEEAPGA